MGTEPIQPVKWSVSIETMIHFDGDGDGDGHGDGTCKQTLFQSVGVSRGYTDHHQGRGHP